ncbi:unannotated protein [freshwater metagenome]|uniref:Unannotated protein n=1 Tax=freshwater metagenome TaxID=449393 RepID=A0A6J6IMB1_9ZZZZ|nr:hypothetical protein [Actinomycetota bacterium]
MTNKDEFDQRLAKADPTEKKVAPTLSDQLLTKAASGDSRLSLRSRFELASQNLRRLTVGSLVSGSAAVVVLALVVTAQPQPLIQLSGMQGARNSESAAAQMDGGADKMYMPFFNFEYLAGPNLSSETGSGQVYKLVRQSSAEEVLANVASVFDVSGSINKYPDFNETNPGYFFGQSKDPWGYDGQNPVISLWWSGTASWNYSNPIAYPASECEQTDEAGNCSSWTEYKPTPELLPTREEAVAKALEVFNATGLSVTEGDLRVDISEWGVNVSAALNVDGSPTNIEWYLGWSSTGVISYAGGHSVVPEAMGTFDTISALDSVARLADWRWSGSPSSIFYEKFQPSYASIEPAPFIRGDDSAVSESPSDGGEASSDVVEPTPITIDEPIPGDQPEPETRVLTIMEAESALLSVWDANGEVWLVPGFILVNDQGWFGAVISLIEGVLELPKETEIDIVPMPAEDSDLSNK